tara:strand:+ start:1288 stop:1413 length:126 start_codon:yes stop_codon:yes gene_type:complete
MKEFLKIYLRIRKNRIYKKKLENLSFYANVKNINKKNGLKN